jgi:hypothetical protein
MKDDNKNNEIEPCTIHGVVCCAGRNLIINNCNSLKRLTAIAYTLC